ncbi:MAG: hypothetical protein LBH57_02355 [Treponema sp.]|jgi:hypothetical protein|nr:hypothetical protein [Treponema sp.]
MKQLYNFLLPLLLSAPDGTGGGGTPPAETSLDEWIKRLNAAEIKDRLAIVEEMAKAFEIKTKEAFKRLKEAGWDPKTNSETLNTAAPPAAGERPGRGTSALPDDTRPGASMKTEAPAAGGLAVALRHKTPYPRYRRAGLVLANQFKNYTVTAEQLAALEADTWVEVKKPARQEKE